MTQPPDSTPSQRSLKPRADSLREAETNAAAGHRRETMRSMSETRSANPDPTRGPSPTPDVVRRELHRHAEQAARRGRVQDTIALMVAANIMKNMAEEGEPPERKPPPLEPPYPERWTNLAQFDQDELPSAIWTPDGRVRDVEYWIDLLVAVAEWAIRQHLLTRRECPVTVGKSRTPIIEADMPARKPGQRSINHREIAGKMHLYLKFNRQDIRANCRNLLRKLGIEPDIFYVKTG